MMLNFNLTAEICGNMSIGTIRNKSGVGAEDHLESDENRTYGTNGLDINTKRPYSEHYYTYILHIFMGAGIYIIIREAFWLQR